MNWGRDWKLPEGKFLKPQTVWFEIAESTVLARHYLNSCCHDWCYVVRRILWRMRVWENEEHLVSNDKVNAIMAKFRHHSTIQVQWVSGWRVMRRRKCQAKTGGERQPQKTKGKWKRKKICTETSLFEVHIGIEPISPESESDLWDISPGLFIDICAWSSPCWPLHQWTRCVRSAI